MAQISVKRSMIQVSYFQYEEMIGVIGVILMHPVIYVRYCRLFLDVASFFEELDG